MVKKIFDSYTSKIVEVKTLTCWFLSYSHYLYILSTGISGNYFIKTPLHWLLTTLTQSTLAYWH